MSCKHINVHVETYVEITVEIDSFVISSEDVSISSML